jgi:integrase
MLPSDPSCLFGAYNFFLRDQDMPRKPLSNTSVNALQAPQAGQILVWDTKLTGFGVRLSAGGKRVYVAQGRAHGRTVRISVGRADHLSCEQARTQAKVRLGELAGGVDHNRDKKLKRVQGIPLATAFKEFCKVRVNNKISTLHLYERYLDSYLPDWKPRSWTAVTRRMILDRHRKIGDEHGQRTANNVMRTLRSLLSFCRATYRDPATGVPLNAENPVRALSDTKAWFKEAGREDHLKPSEIKSWWQAVAEEGDETQTDYLYGLLLTGLRSMELAALRWKAVNLKDRVITFTDTKNGSTHRLPICNWLQSALERRAVGTNSFDFVFPATGKSPSKAGHVKWFNRLLMRVAEKSNVEMQTRHGLRRTFASIGEQLGVGTFTLKRLMNHHLGTSSDITMQYAQLSVEALRKPAEDIATYILKCAGKLESAHIVPFSKSATGQRPNT